jgi:hypothetical protein
MMWALEYDPDIFSTYEETGVATSNIGGFKPKVKSMRQFGKYEREKMKNRAHEDDGPVPISVFLVASVLKENSPKLLQEARGINDVIRASWIQTILTLKSLSLFSLFFKTEMHKAGSQFSYYINNPHLRRQNGTLLKGHRYWICCRSG